eukprot:6204871-Pleurochrysis_carterae.AAC.5
MFQHGRKLIIQRKDTVCPARQYVRRKDRINDWQGRRDRTCRRAHALLRKLLLCRAVGAHEARIRALEVRLILCAMCMHACTFQGDFDVSAREGGRGVALASQLFDGGFACGAKRLASFAAPVRQIAQSENLARNSEGDDMGHPLCLLGIELEQVNRWRC